MLLLALSLGFSGSGSAEIQPEAPSAEAAATSAAMEALAAAAAEARRIEEQRRLTHGELEAIASSIAVSREELEAMDREIAALAADRQALSEALVAAADAQKSASAELSTLEAELDRLAGSQGALRASFDARRGTLAQVLGALERMGRKPAPAILVHPDDALGSVRSAILLGSVVPVIRAETDALLADLAEMSRLKAEIETRQTRFAETLARQRGEEARLSRLLAEKQRREASTQEARERMNRRAAELASRAAGLEDLIGSLEEDLARAESAQARAQELAERERAEAAERLAQAAETEAAEAAQAEAERAAAEAAPTYDIASLRRDMARLDVSAPFSTMKGSLNRPVSGDLQQAFGAMDRFGRRAEGMTFLARAGDLVTAPADGRILYSGPFRSYGQLLILNAGDGYHIVLAGMREIDVDVGQFVLAGEPVAVMGGTRLASAGPIELPANEPSLYVEFRRNGKPVDPAPWWAEEPSGRTGNDS